MIADSVRDRQEAKAREALVAWLTLVMREYGPTAQVDWLGIKGEFIRTLSPQFTETFRVGGRTALDQLLKKQPGATDIFRDRGWDPDIMIDGSQWGHNNATVLVDGLVTNIQGTMGGVLLGPGDGVSHAQAWHDALEVQCSPARADGIAITETTRAISAGQDDFINQIRGLGIDQKLVWWTKQDMKVCRICRPRHGMEVEYAGYPPAHPRCRCNTEMR